jgi:uncharacterized protein (DUF3820 family)
LSRLRRGMTMPFGKHKGEFVEDLPPDYVEWLLENVERLNPSLQEELEKQLAMKRGEGAAR